MGLAEPRKRVKISHDPRNLQWLSPGSDSSASFGKRLMQQQGWHQGQALGARPPANANANGLLHELDAQRLAAAKVGVIIKDDTLGLGAQLRSKDVAHQKTGLDAFQGLLGRLNAKGEEELQEVERKEGDRKLETYTRSRWGGVVFVRGGLLVPEGKEFKQQQQQQQQQQLLEEKKEKKREGKKKSKEKIIKKKVAQKEEEKDEVTVSLSRPVSVAAPDEPKTSGEEEDKASAAGQGSKKTKETKKDKEKKKKKKKKRGRSSTVAVEEVAAAATKKQAVQLNNGRHILRGRNIEAKRKAFSDTKGLDAIFMRTTTTATVATPS